MISVSLEETTSCAQKLGLKIRIGGGRVRCKELEVKAECQSHPDRDQRHVAVLLDTRSASQFI